MKNPEETIGKIIDNSANSRSKRTAGQDAEFIHEICESVRERSGLTGACACDNTDVAFGAGNGV